MGAALVVSVCGSSIATAQTRNSAGVSPTSAPDAVSINNRTWSGEIDDARGGRGSITVRFSSDGGTFVASFCCNMSNVGTITNFAQTSDGHATFVLHSSRQAGCDYSVTAFAEDGHLKGSYQGCGNNSGSFDLTSFNARSYQVQGVASVRVSQSSQSSSCTVTVTVKNNFGHPIKGARLVLTSPGYLPQKVRTDTSGTSKFSAKPGAYNLSVQANGYDGPGPTDFTLLPGVANAGGCNEVLTATLTKTPPPTPEPTPGPLNRAYENAVATYCKTATVNACLYYRSDALQCFSPALKADTTYQMVAYWKKQGLSTQRAVNQMSTDPDSAIIASAAGKMIDDHDHYDKTSFEMAVMRLCLAGVTK